MISGTMIVNAFLRSEQTDKTYEWLRSSAERHGIDMDFKTNADYFAMIDTRDVSALPAKSDFILFWSKDVTLGRALEGKGMRLFNPSKAIELCDNKALTIEALSGKVKMVKTVKLPMTFTGIGYTSLDFADRLMEILGCPFVIKECLGSYGGQVYLAKSKEEACSILKKIEGRDAIAQEYVSSSRGRDIRAYVVGGEAVASIERRNDSDFRANIAAGGYARKVELTNDEKEMAVTAASELGLDFAGVDLLYGENDEPLLCEVNSNAQFAGLYEATGIDVTDFIFEHIMSTVGEHTK